MMKHSDTEIEVRKLTHYYHEQIVLEQCNLTVKKGESIGILGASGCGKSTLLKYLAGLYEASDNNVMVAGNTEAALIRKNVAMVMQEAFLLPGTIRENITCGHAMEKKWIDYVCGMAGLSDWISTLPLGIDTYLGDRANELSGGQAQRIAIARAMAKNAPVILLDEATSALDRVTGEAVMEAIGKLTCDKTVIHVTHHPEMLVDYDRVLRMEGGRLYE